MKKLLTVMLIGLISLLGVSNVNAAEVGLDSIATVSSNVGTSEKEITMLDTTGQYKFYYKYVQIEEIDFASYVESKYAVDNNTKSGDELTNAASEVSSFEDSFKALIPEVAVADLEGWTLVNDGQISVSDLSYTEEKHTGYVLAVAAVKDGDNDNIYVNRLILESTSATTMNVLTYTDQDNKLYGSEVSATSEQVSTGSNPSTGLSDYALYLVPISIVLGAGLLFRKSYS